MKKFAATVLLFVLLFSVSLSEVDISGMSVEELMALRLQIDEKIGYPIQGDFVTGVDIKEGYYRITYIDNRENIPYDERAYIVHYKDELRNDKVSPSRSLNPGDTYIIHLVEHNVLRVNYASVLLIPMEDPSWKP